MWVTQRCHVRCAVGPTIIHIKNFRSLKSRFNDLLTKLSQDYGIPNRYSLDIYSTSAPRHVKGFNFYCSGFVIQMPALFGVLRRIHFALSYHIRFTRALDSVEDRRTFVRIKLLALQIAMCYPDLQKEVCNLYYCVITLFVCVTASSARLCLVGSLALRLIESCCGIPYAVRTQLWEYIGRTDPQMVEGLVDVLKCATLVPTDIHCLTFDALRHLARSVSWRFTFGTLCLALETVFDNLICGYCY